MIFFCIFALAAVVSCIALCRIRYKQRIRKAREKVYNDYLKEQMILELNFFNAYYTMLQAAQRQKDGWQF